VLLVWLTRLEPGRESTPFRFHEVSAVVIELLLRPGGTVTEKNDPAEWGGEKEGVVKAITLSLYVELEE
jgi:hypothetical protein